MQIRENWPSLSEKRKERNSHPENNKEQDFHVSPIRTFLLLFVSGILISANKQPCIFSYVFAL